MVRKDNEFEEPVATRIPKVSAKQMFKVLGMKVLVEVVWLALVLE